MAGLPPSVGQASVLAIAIFIPFGGQVGAMGATAPVQFAGKPFQARRGFPAASALDNCYKMCSYINHGFRHGAGSPPGEFMSSGAL
jgi:hypothetical protein